MSERQRTRQNECEAENENGNMRLKISKHEANHGTRNAGMGIRCLEGKLKDEKNKHGTEK